MSKFQRESAPEELDTEDLVSECVGQVCRRKAVDALRLMNSNDTRLQPEKRRKKIPRMQ